MFGKEGVAYHYGRVPRMALRIRLPDSEKTLVQRNRLKHEKVMVRRRMDVLWLLHHGRTRAEAAVITGVARGTVQRYVADYREGGMEALFRSERTVPVSDMEDHRNILLASFRETPLRSVAKAAERIERLTGLRRGPSAGARVSSNGMGCAGNGWRRPRRSPSPPKKCGRACGRAAAILRGTAKTMLGCGPKRRKGTCLSWMRPISSSGPSCVACGRSRGFSCGPRRAGNGSTCWGLGTRSLRELIAVTNTTVVNTETMCELLRKIAAAGLERSDHVGVGQRAVSAKRGRARLGGGVGDHAALYRRRIRRT